MSMSIISPLKDSPPEFGVLRQFAPRVLLISLATSLSPRFPLSLAFSHLLSFLPVLFDSYFFQCLCLLFAFNEPFARVYSSRCFLALITKVLDSGFSWSTTSIKLSIVRINVVQVRDCRTVVSKCVLIFSPFDLRIARERTFHRGGCGTWTCLKFVLSL